MNSKNEINLSRRQEEILEVIIRLRKASVKEIMHNLNDPPTDGAIRRMLNILYQKSAVDYYSEGVKKIYFSKIDTMLARRKALNRVIDTFFAGSSARAIASILQDNKLDLTGEERNILLELIEKTKQSGR